MSPRPFAAFSLLDPEAEHFRAFDSVRRTPTVAGMVRHVAAAAAKVHRPDDPSWVSSYVEGHGSGPNEPATTEQRLSYIPIPTIEERKVDGQRSLVVDSIRRVLVVEPAYGDGEQIAWVRQRLSGQSLIDERSGNPSATLSLIPKKDPRLRWYVPEGGARVWSTVTPVILPGFDDRNGRKTEQLLRRVLEQAGLPAQLRDSAVLESRPVGYWAGLDLARHYCVCSHHQRYTRCHVRITWPVPVSGPLCLGRGRYYGMGLFAAESLP